MEWLFWIVIVFLVLFIIAYGIISLHFSKNIAQPKVLSLEKEMAWKRNIICGEILIIMIKRPIRLTGIKIIHCMSS